MPDKKSETLGLNVLDEPRARQSDPTVLDLQLRTLAKQTTVKPMVSVEGKEGKIIPPSTSYALCFYLLVLSARLYAVLLILTTRPRRWITGLIVSGTGIDAYCIYRLTSCYNISVFIPVNCIDRNQPQMCITPSKCED